MKSNASRWIRASASAIAMVCSGIALAYPMDVKSTLYGMDLKVTSVGNDMIAAIEIRNNDTRIAKCQVVFVNGPELPDRNLATVAPGKSQTVRFAAKRTVIKLDVTVTCTPAESVNK